MSLKLFTYGSLMSGGRLDRYLKNSKFIKNMDVYFHKLVTMNGSWYPAMIRSYASSIVKGELYEVNEDTLEALKIIEGHPNLFELKTVGVQDKDIRGVLAFVGVHDQFYSDKAITVPKGDWKLWLKKNK